ncbi:MAG: amidohydrolase family protein [Bryobacteraceae bacterium]
MLTLRGSQKPRRGDTLTNLGILRDGAILIHDGRVTEVGPSRRVENLGLARYAREIDATGCIVMPGFVDCHTHLVSAAACRDNREARGLSVSEDADLVSLVSARHLETQSRKLLHGMMRHGTTTLECKTGYGLDEGRELRILRMLANLHQGPLDIVASFVNPRSSRHLRRDDLRVYCEWVCNDFMPKVKGKDLVRFAEFDPGSDLMACEERFLDTAKRLGFQLKFCARGDRTKQIVQLALQWGAVSVGHLDYADARDVELLATSETVPVLLPGESFYMGSGRPTLARELIDAGAAVALATASHPATAPSYSMQMMLSLGSTLFHMTAEEVICAATWNAACAIGAQKTAGSIECGKPADLVILNVTDYHDLPNCFGVNLVRRTIKRGATVYEEKEPGEPPHRGLCCQ